MRQLIAVPVLALGAATPAVAATPGDGAAQNGAGVAPSAPAVRAISCLPSGLTACTSSRSAVRGGAVRVSGTALKGARTVIFRGRASSRRDDTSAKPMRTRSSSLDVVVPSKARTGRIAVVDRYGRRAVSRISVRVGAAPAVDAAPGTGFFAGGRRKPTLTLPAAPTGPVDVTVLGEDGTEVGTFEDRGSDASIAWNGLLGGRGAPTGRYRLRAEGVTGDEFTLFDSIFPVRGKHDIAPSYTTRFGGGRNHQGVDTFAKCGTRLVAARSGKIQYAGFQSRAGNYLVIDIDGSGVDEAYMHMREPALVRAGQRVFTGQQVGQVGDTGDAQGCHLHFEMWTAPGWYQGGHPFDPQPSLERWDRYE